MDCLETDIVEAGSYGVAWIHPAPLLGEVKGCCELWGSIKCKELLD
jgi:hypothetical protein